MAITSLCFCSLLNFASASARRYSDPMSYSAVRATLNLLVKKKWLKYRKGEVKYLYSAAADRRQTRLSAVERLLATCFGNSATEAVAALLDVSASRLTDEQLQDMIRMIEKARKGGKS